MNAAFGCLLGGILLALAVVDLHRMILPNRLNLLLAGAGAAQSMALGVPSVVDAALGAFTGSACLFLVAALFRHFRGTDGLGLGDLKFTAAAGVWTGWQGIPLMLCIASASALAFFSIRAIAHRELDRTAPLPFGPFLGLGTLFTWLTTVLS